MGLKGLEMKLKDMHTYLEQVNKQKQKNRQIAMNF